MMDETHIEQFPIKPNHNNSFKLVTDETVINDNNDKIINDQPHEKIVDTENSKHAPELELSIL